jgi:hypothetical protein
MDQTIATVIVAVIGAGASIAVALITTRAKIGPSPPETRDEKPRSTYADSSKGAAKRASTRIFRAFGWILVIVLYIMGGFMVFGTGIAAIQGASIGQMLPGIVTAAALLVAAVWGDRRLRSQSN